MLLPRITALGALDEAPLALAGALDLPPAVEPMQRLAVLASLILAMNGRGRRAAAPPTAPGGWPRELAALMDEAERAEIDLARAAAGRRPTRDYAAHWAQTLGFLRIVTGAWPAWLAEQRRDEPGRAPGRAAGRAGRGLGSEPPDRAGAGRRHDGGIPAVARLLRVVARPAAGRWCCRGWTLGMTRRSLGRAGRQRIRRRACARLLADLGATRGDVRPWTAARTARAQPATAAASPAVAAPCCRAARCTTGRTRPRVPLDWAVAAERRPTSRRRRRPSPWCCATRWRRRARRAALVTPDRDAGGPGRGRPAALRHRRRRQRRRDPGRHAARPCSCGCWRAPWPSELAPVAAAGVAEASAGRRRHDAGRLPRRRAGAGARLPARAAADARASPACARRWTTRRAPSRRRGVPEPAGDLPGAGCCGIDCGRWRSRRPRRCAALIEAAEALAATDETPGAHAAVGRRGGRGAGDAAGRGCRPRCRRLPDQRRRRACPACSTRCWRARSSAAAGRCAGAAARSIRACSSGACSRRGCNRSDLIVLGGLAEGVWPPATEPGPWMSRPMRARVGLPRPRKRSARPRTISLPPAARPRASCCPARRGATARRPCRRAG